MYWIYFYLLFIISVNENAFAFKCYTCSATDEDTCKQTQTHEICKHKKSKCMTITYNKNIEDENRTTTTHTFMKRCVSYTADCNAFCGYIRQANGQNCMVSCCARYLCNKAVKKDEIWFYRIRRNKNGCTINRQNIIWITILLLMYIALI